MSDDPDKAFKDLLADAAPQSVAALEAVIAGLADGTFTSFAVAAIGPDQVFTTWDARSNRFEAIGAVDYLRHRMVSQIDGSDD